MNKKVRVIITIILSIIEWFILYITFIFTDSLISKEILDLFNSYLSLIALLTPAPILYLVNYYLISPFIYKISLEVWHKLGHYNYLKNDYKKIVEEGINWLIGIKTMWGPNVTSEVPQNANTCEVLIALRKSELYKGKQYIFKNALNDVLDNVTNEGLPSKSLNMATVVCTSMMLYLLSYEQKDSFCSLKNYDKYNQIASLLWEIRGKNGWGVYMDLTESDECSFANTNWALRALMTYKSKDLNEEEIFEYLKSIYEYSFEGTFGFFIGDSAKLVTTSMYLILYYQLDSEKKEEISKIYDYKAAINFIHNSFVKKKIQSETETLTGIDKVQPGAKKAPWTHVSSGYAIEALLLAYKNNDLDIIKSNSFFKQVNKIINNNITRITVSGTCYYIPEEIQCRQGKILTFPTTYIINGLSTFIK